MLRMIYYWAQDLPQNYVQFECGIGSNSTIVDYFMYMRQVCHEILESTPYMLGGPDSIVEVDEAKLGRRKFHRGRRIEGQWIFGILERGTNRCVVDPVKDRTEETLLSEIRKFVLLGTTIISDCWASYGGLDRMGYRHLTVNHSKCFKDPISGAHTNSVEGMWNLVRKSLPKFGTTKDMYASYMVEYMYRRRFFPISIVETDFLYFSAT
jgi:transposase-like protein